MSFRLDSEIFGNIRKCRFVTVRKYSLEFGNIISSRFVRSNRNGWKCFVGVLYFIIAIDTIDEIKCHCSESSIMSLLVLRERYNNEYKRILIDLVNNNDIMLNRSVHRISNLKCLKKLYFDTISKHNSSIYNLKYITLYFTYIIFINRLRIFMRLKHNGIFN